MTEEDRAMPAHPDRLAVVAARAGTASHLVDLSQGQKDTSLCGVPTAFGQPVAWFALAGCKRCARAAARQGFTTVNDVDGERLELVNVIDGLP